MAGIHAKLSPSSAARWMTCPGSVILCEGLEDRSSKAADEGTMMHLVASECLDNNLDAAADFESLTPEQAQSVQTYVNNVRSIVASTGGILLVEQRLPIEHMTGEEGATGTADAVILTPDEFIVIDAKFGRGVVVDVVENAQLMMYAHAAYVEFGHAYSPTRVRMIVDQPRLGALSEWTISVPELEGFAHKVQRTTWAIGLHDETLNPSPKACQWCRAKATCPAIREQVLADFDVVVPETADDADLGRVMTNASLIEAWVKAVRAEVERRLLAGESVRGYKLVQGKRGNRAWGDPAVAEEALKKMRIKHDQMYNYSLASPTNIEWVFKQGDLGPRQWAKVQELITQAEGRPSVAPETDKRPALVTSAAASDFDDVTTPTPQGEEA
jgi:hypothetical protein